MKQDLLYFLYNNLDLGVYGNNYVPVVFTRGVDGELSSHLDTDKEDYLSEDLVGKLNIGGELLELNKDHNVTSIYDFSEKLLEDIEKLYSNSNSISEFKESLLESNIFRRTKTEANLESEVNYYEVYIKEVMESNSNKISYKLKNFIENSGTIELINVWNSTKPNTKSNPHLIVPMGDDYSLMLSYTHTLNKENSQFSVIILSGGIDHKVMKLVFNNGVWKTKSYLEEDQLEDLYSEFFSDAKGFNIVKEAYDTALKHIMTYFK